MHLNNASATNTLHLLGPVHFHKLPFFNKLINQKVSSFVLYFVFSLSYFPKKKGKEMKMTNNNVVQTMIIFDLSFFMYGAYHKILINRIKTIMTIKFNLERYNFLFIFL